MSLKSPNITICIIKNAGEDDNTKKTWRNKKKTTVSDLGAGVDKIR